MLTAGQLRAARGLLDWTRAELAKAAGVSPETIKNIEHGTFKPQEATAAAIEKAFGNHGVEFAEDEGVRRRYNPIINYEGRDDFKRYADDVYQILLKNPDARHIYIFGNNDKEFIEALGDYASVHLERMAKLPDLDFKTLVVENNDTFMTDYIEYRRMPQVSYAIPFSVYGNRFDFIIYGEGSHFPKVVAIKSQVVADAYRGQFLAMWKISKEVKGV